jgi:hypothetical protein
LDAPPAAHVFWLPQDDTSAIVLAQAPAILFAGADRSATLDSSVSVHDGDETFLLHDIGAGQSVQLVREGEFPADAPVAALVPLGIEGFDRLESIYRLLAALHGRAVPPDTRLTKQQRARLRRMLQCVDGYRDGATQQEIAQVIFRIGPLERDDWQAPSPTCCASCSRANFRQLQETHHDRHRGLPHARRPVAGRAPA